MLVKAVYLDRTKYTLVSDDYIPQGNTYTIIVGSNGTGKSRILKRIVNCIKNIKKIKQKIPNNYSRHLDIENKQGCFSYFGPSSESCSILSKSKDSLNITNCDESVIAVTTTPFDKFPVEYKGGNLYRYSDEEKYKYIGLKQSKNSFSQTNLLNLLLRTFLKIPSLIDDEKTFDMLGLKNHIHFFLKSKISEPYIYTGEKNKTTVDITKLKITNAIEAKKYISSNKISEKSFINKLTQGNQSILANIADQNISIHEIMIAYFVSCKWLNGIIDPREKELPTKELTLLLDIGIINVSEINFVNSQNSIINEKSLSSGQKCLILTILNIAGVISDDCVICIDEPEISLHPKWQKEYIGTLIKLFSTYKRCHFIVATHSPLIVSEISEKNCFILNMEDCDAHRAEDNKKMSSDFQLAEVFGVTGNNNEYLNRLTVSLLSSLSRNGTLDRDEQEKIKLLKSLQPQMEIGDSVRELIEILLDAWKRVSPR